MVDITEVPADAHWRDSARTPRLMIFDYRATFPIVFFLFFWSWTVFWFVVASMLFFYALERYGFTVVVFLRWLRASFLAGKYKSATPWWLIG